MESLVRAMLNNALAAAGLALIVAAIARTCRQPALVHSLWVVVLLKLVTPPLLTIPLPSLELPDPARSHSAGSLSECPSSPAGAAGSLSVLAGDALEVNLVDTRSRGSPVGPTQKTPVVPANSHRGVVEISKSLFAIDLLKVLTRFTWQCWLLLFFVSAQSRVGSSH